MDGQVLRVNTLSNPKIEAFAQQLFTVANRKDIAYLEVSITEKEGLHLSVGQGALEGMTAFNESVVSLRGVYKGRLGTTYTELISAENAETLIESLVESATLGSLSGLNPKPSYKQDFAAALLGDNVTAVSTKVEMLLALEQAAVEAAPEIQKTDFCEYQEFHKKRYLLTSGGLDLRECSRICTAAVSAVAERSGTIRTAFASETAGCADKLQIQQLGKDTGLLAARSLTGGSIASGVYPVILVNTVTAALLEGFAPVFCADRVLDKLSALEGKIGQAVATGMLSIVDDPKLEGGGRTMHFDDEGTLTSKLRLIQDGRLIGFLHNEKTAKAFNVSSTGHGIRPSHKSGVEVQPSNLWIEKGQISFEELMMLMGNGLLITDVQGTFAGINAISGEFSLQASGFKVEAGIATFGVNNITISGNFFDLLLAIAGIADDLKFGMPYGAYVGAPSIFVPKLTVAGE